MVRFFLLTASLLLGPGPKDPPRLRITPPGLVDLGSVGPREIREQVYGVRNVSAAPVALRILDLAPGAEAALVLRLDPEGWLGFQARKVRLATDDPRQGDYYLPAKVFIRPDLTVDGVRRDFGDVGAHESPRMVFAFTRETGEPVALRLGGALPPYLEGEVLPGAGGGRLALTLRPALIPPGSRLGLEEVRVETSAPLQPFFDLYLSWRVHHAVDAEPARVVFQAPDRPFLALRLASHDGRPFRLRGAVVEGGGFRVGPLPAEARSSQVLLLRRTAPAGGRAVLVLSFQGQDRDLAVPLAYLPTGDGVRSAAPGRAGPPPASR